MKISIKRFNNLTNKLVKKNKTKEILFLFELKYYISNFFNETNYKLNYLEKLKYSYIVNIINHINMYKDSDFKLRIISDYSSKFIN